LHDENAIPITNKTARIIKVLFTGIEFNLTILKLRDIPENLSEQK